MRSDDDSNPSDQSTRVLIRTLPLSNANYGGILQAYALQRTLADMGLDPVTDISVSNELNGAAKWMAHRAVAMLPRWAFRSGRFSDWRSSILNEQMNAGLSGNIWPFVERNISTTRLYTRRGVADRALIRSCDKYVVGSDQVWRPDYGDVNSYLFNFVEDNNARLVSYAASFGKDFEDFGADFVQSTRPLAQRFRSISVRESSAVRACRENWGVSAVHNVDPTMLISKSQYDLLSAVDSKSIAPQCLTYVLDVDDRVQDVINGLCAELKLTETSLVRRPTNYEEWKRNPADYQQPTVGTWLRAFAEAKFVITDSFHGTVFAIINGKPFVSLSNSSRGLSRFESLLGTLELEDRLIQPNSGIDHHVVNRAIDWNRVETTIADKRNQALAYLKSALVT